MADDTDTTHPGEVDDEAVIVRAIEAVLDRRWMSSDDAGDAIRTAYPIIAAAVREQVEAAAYEQGRRDAHGTIPARIAAAERAVREQVAQDIEREAEREKDHFPPRWPGDTFWEGVTSGKRRAAGIARDSR